MYSVSLGKENDWRPSIKGIGVLIGFLITVFGFSMVGNQFIIAKLIGLLLGFTGLASVVAAGQDIVSTLLSETFETGSTMTIEYALCAAPSTRLKCQNLLLSITN